ncbi:sigma-70 family RNA polymerase sigma factor [Pleionea sediminis]|uniref:sigma-70 family RNA polymerase sigma factor n=1 Tax=Pleionea sediminis TaxID=2569479 RepID=UPI001186B33F|nr:sigma-70 family RNA polymerase sigma factor [Pleionea sediminis]
MASVVSIKEFKKKSSKLNSNTAKSERSIQNQHWIDCLVNVAKTQDQSAFKELFDHFAPKIKMFFIKQNLSQQEAEELMQETFISVWRYADYFEANKGQVSTWIYTIARNKKLDYFRKSSRQVTTTEMASEEMAVDSGTQFESRMGDEVSSFLPELPEEQVEVIKKVYFEELSHQKAADALNITLGTVKGRIRSAVNNLNKLMRGGL